MAKKNINLDEVLDFVKNLPFDKFSKVVKHYSKHSKANFEKELDYITTLNFQQRLEKLGINNTCPKCNSKSVIKNGVRNNRVQEYKCKDCNTKFTLFTNTILEKTKWHWDIWIKVLEMTINSYSLADMLNVLEKDYGCVGINVKTIWLWIMKLIHSPALMPMPILSGVIQVDETFIRESQKGSRTLINYINKEEDRQPRYGRKPSEYGVMGAEFATITTAIDNTGYCVCKVSGLGKLTKEIFVDLFENHFKTPAYICSDANDVYEN